MNYFDQESERLVFRKAGISDIPSWAEFFTNNASLKFLGIDLTKNPATHATEWVNRQLARYEEEGLGHLAVLDKSSKELIGMGGILQRELNHAREYEIAYSLKPKFWGKGFGTEIAMQMKKFGMENQIADRFVSIIDKENKASISVAEKNGMTLLYETMYLGMDVFVYGIESRTESHAKR